MSAPMSSALLTTRGDSVTAMSTPTRSSTRDGPSTYPPMRFSTAGRQTGGSRAVVSRGQEGEERWPISARVDALR